MSDYKKPWERQPGESVKAFDAFEVYLYMGSQRSIRAVSEKLSKSEALIKRWSSQWYWVRRVAEFRSEDARQAREARNNAIREMQDRHYQLGMGLESMATYELEILQAKASAELDKNPVERLSVANISQLLRFAELGSRIQREAKGVGVKFGGNQSNPTEQDQDDIILTIGDDSAYNKRKLEEKYSLEGSVAGRANEEDPEDF